MHLIFKILYTAFLICCLNLWLVVYSRHQQISNKSQQLFWFVICVSQPLRKYFINRLNGPQDAPSTPPFLFPKPRGACQIVNLGGSIGGSSENRCFSCLWQSKMRNRKAENRALYKASYNISATTWSEWALIANTAWILTPSLRRFSASLLEEEGWMTREAARGTGNVGLGTHTWAEFEVSRE